MKKQPHFILHVTTVVMTNLCVLTLIAHISLGQPPPAGGMMGPSPGGQGGPGGGPGQRGGPGGQGPDRLMENFFPPEMVMQNQKAISLTADQQSAIRAEMQKSMSRFTDLRWQQSAEEETMASLVKQEHPDEKAVMAQLDKLLKIENEVKHINLASMVRIKNILTPEQQSMLREMQKQHGGQQRSQGPSPRRSDGQGQSQGSAEGQPPPQDDEPHGG